MLRGSSGRRAKIATRARSSQPVVVPRLASPRLASCQQKKEARTLLLPGPADVAATSNGLPTSPRARNSVTVRAVDIADAYSMSDGSSPRGAGERERMPVGRDRRKMAGIAIDRGTGKIFRRKNATRIEGDAV